MDKSELMSMTVKDLRGEAERLGLKRISALRKDELVDAILKAAAAQNSEKTKRGSASKKAAATKTDAKNSTKSKAEPKADDKSLKSDKSEQETDKKSQKDSKSGKKFDPISQKKSKSKVQSKVADKEDEAAELEEDAEKLEAEEKEEAEEKVEEKAPEPVEPGSVFIDRGAVLPEYIPGTCLFALIRDPGTIFVYWNAEFESDNGWLLTAYDREGRVMQQFSTPARRNGRGYFRVPSSQVARVTLSEIHADGHHDVKLESRVRIAEQMRLIPPRAYDERWIDVQSREVVYEAPAPGYAPQSPEITPRMIAPAVTGGGYDRSVEQSDHPYGCSSSRFGAVGAPGSSEIFAVGSSDNNLRRRS